VRPYQDLSQNVKKKRKGRKNRIPALLFSGMILVVYVQEDI
jgi:hypothetical protein